MKNYGNALEIEAETKKLWDMAKSRLCDQPLTPWQNLIDFKNEGGIVAVISARRAYVKDLKPILRKEGVITTFGQPGDSMSGLRGKESDTWIFPWLAKTIGAISAVVNYKVCLNPNEKPRVKLVFCSAAMGTGSQSEWEHLQQLSGKIIQEIDGANFSMDHAVVDPLEVLHFYGLDAAHMDSIYYKKWKKIYFVRHGQSQSNVEGDMLYPPLTPVGEQQAYLLGRKKTFHVDTLVCSPHARTLQTLKHLSITCQHAIISSTVAEMNRKEQQNRVPDQNQLHLLNVPALQSTNFQIELFADEADLDNAELKERVLQRLADIPGSEILIVTHRVVIRELTNEDVDNCGVVTCTLEHGSIENVQAE